MLKKFVESLFYGKLQCGFQRLNRIIIWHNFDSEKVPSSSAHLVRRVIIRTVYFHMMIDIDARIARKREPSALQFSVRMLNGWNRCNSFLKCALRGNFLPIPICQAAHAKLLYRFRVIVNHDKWLFCSLLGIAAAESKKPLNARIPEHRHSTNHSMPRMPEAQMP